MTRTYGHRCPTDHDAWEARRRLASRLKGRDGWLAWAAADAACAAALFAASRHAATPGLIELAAEHLSATSARLLFFVAYAGAVVLLRSALVRLRGFLSNEAPPPDADDPRCAPAAVTPADLQDLPPDAPGESEPLQGLPTTPRLRRRAFADVAERLLGAGAVVAVVWGAGVAFPIGVSIPLYAAARLYRISAALGLSGCRDVLHPAALDLHGVPGAPLPLSDLCVVCTRRPSREFQWIIIEPAGRRPRPRFLHAEAVGILLRRLGAQQATEPPRDQRPVPPP